MLHEISVDAVIDRARKDAQLAKVAKSQPVVKDTKAVRVLIVRGMAYGDRFAIGIDAEGQVVADTGDKTVVLRRDRHGEHYGFQDRRNYHVHIKDIFSGELLRNAVKAARRRHGITA